MSRGGEGGLTFVNERSAVTYGLGNQNSAGGGVAGAGAPNQPIAAGVLGKQADQLMAELARLAATLATQNEREVPHAIGANGAPAIGNVLLEISADDMVLMIQSLRSKTQDAQLKNQHNGLELRKVDLEEMNQKALDKLNEWIRESTEASAKEKASKVAGLAGAIAGVVAAIVALAVAIAVTVLTVGAGTPLLALGGKALAAAICFAVVGVVAASISLASQVSVSNGGEPIQLAKMLVKAIMDSLVDTQKMSEEDASKLAKILTGVVGMFGAFLLDPAFAAQAITGVAELLGASADQSAIVEMTFTLLATLAIMIAMVAITGGAALSSAVAGVSKLVSAAGSIAQATASAVGAAATITQGSYKIAEGYDQREADLLQADRVSISAVISKLQRQMEQDTEDFKKILTEIMDGMTLVSQMINSAAQSRSQITANIFGKGPTV